MSIILRISLFFMLTIGLVVGWWFVWIPLLALYLYRYTAYELLFLGWFIDLGFGPQAFPPLYLTLFAALLCATEWLKPQLLVYTEHTS